jgi:acetyl-CoA acyltransferase
VRRFTGLKRRHGAYLGVNEALQSIAVIHRAGLNTDIMKASMAARSHWVPLGCTGAKLSVQIFDEMRKRGNQGKYCGGNCV